MKRREYLALAGGLGAATAGCAVRAPGVTEAGSGAGGTAGDGAGETVGDGAAPALAATGTPPDICQRPINPEAGIPAILEPAFAPDWDAHDIGVAYQHYRQGPHLVADQPVIGVAWDGGARAYPITVLLHHEVVNDTAGEPLLVTYCPLCRSGMVAARRVGGEVTRFAVTGQLWRPERIAVGASQQDGSVFGVSYAGETGDVRANANLVLYDAASGSYWSQLLARAICGPLSGTDLAIRPSRVATWADWRASHPETEVLLPPPHSRTVEPGAVLGGE